MLTARQWHRMRANETAILLNSTKAGQNLINGVTRRIVAFRVTRPTKSNPHGLGTRLVKIGPIPNPLLNSVGSSLANLTSKKVASGYRVNRNGSTQTGRWVNTVGDNVRHNTAKAASL